MELVMQSENGVKIDPILVLQGQVNSFAIW